MSNSVPLLLIDGNNLLYRAAYGFPTRIYNSRKEDITTVFAFFALLRIAFNEIGYPLSPIICFDGEHSLDERRLLQSSYKSNRDNSRLNPYGDLPAVLNSLRSLGMPFVIEDTLEADDLIAEFVDQNISISSSYIMSSDKDFYQLLQENVFILNTMRKNQRIITGKDVTEKFGVCPEQWVYYRALMGDPSDFIKGVPGVGPKSAVKLLELPEIELQQVLFERYKIAWSEFMKMVSIISLRVTKPRLLPQNKICILNTFDSPAKVLHSLGLW